MIVILATGARTYQIFYFGPPHSASDAIKIAIISPNRPKTDPKISMIRTLTKSFSLAASARAAEEPTRPTQIPQNKLQTPKTK